MKGIKRILLGMAIILIASSFLISESYTLGGIGEIIIFGIGLGIAIAGVIREG